MTATRAEARAAKEKLAARLRGNPKVGGVGIAATADGYALKVNLSTADPGVPEGVDGVPVTTEVVGDVKPRDSRAAGR